MSQQSHPIAVPSYSGKDLGEEYLIYDGEGDSLHVLNGTAREIYLLCDGERSDEEVARVLAERYDVSLEIAVRDTRSTLEQLISLGLISLS